jgi:hypothetical protein
MVVVGCSSGGGGAPPPDAATNDAAHDAGRTNDDASTSSAPDGGRDAVAAAAEDATSDSSSNDAATIAVADASAACTSYCSCMAQYCPSETFAGGCLYQCTTQMNWDLACRAVMCALVQSQPNNDHCTHAAGMIQCLDE